MFIYFKDYRNLNPAPSYSNFAFYAYYLSVFPILHMLFVALNIVIWQRTGINYNFIFDIHPQEYKNMTPWKCACFALLLFNAWLVSSLVYMYLTVAEVRYELYMAGYQWLLPLVFLISLLIILFLPLKIFYSTIRKFILTALGRMVLAPFVSSMLTIVLLHVSSSLC